jgi:hypothetical protein
MAPKSPRPNSAEGRVAGSCMVHILNQALLVVRNSFNIIKSIFMCDCNKLKQQLDKRAISSAPVDVATLGGMKHKQLMFIPHKERERERERERESRATVE